MTDEEIEFALKQYAIGGGRNVVNMDWAGTLDYINRLKAACESLEQCTIDQHGEIHRLRDELNQIRKDTAKEILRHFPHNRAREFFCKKYDVEVDDE